LISVKFSAVMTHARMIGYVLGRKKKKNYLRSKLKVGKMFKTETKGTVNFPSSVASGRSLVVLSSGVVPMADGAIGFLSRATMISSVAGYVEEAAAVVVVAAVAVVVLAEKHGR
jgi:nicotinamide riboside transporter PnuC